MGQKTILDQKQKEFLELVLNEPYLLKRYYWTGGTVLSEFYLHHRESYDIDLFEENHEVHLPSIKKFIGIAGAKLGCKSIIHRRFLGLQTFTFKFKDSELKVDFNYYPFKRINKGSKWRGIEIDSLEDIAANKVHTISVKPRGRDFVDIYYIFKKENYTIKKLILLAKTKFDWPIDPIQLGQTFAHFEEYKDLPKMLVPFDQDEMRKFYLSLAKELEKEIFK